MSRHTCTCGHIELDTAGTYCCDWHGYTVIEPKQP